ncbi:MAG: DUF7711 family protein [Nocardioides sp.]
MKRSTAVRHLLEMADGCATLEENLAQLDSTVRVVSFWAYGPILLPADPWPSELPFADAAIAIDQPEADVPWYAGPAATGWIEAMEAATGIDHHREPAPTPAELRTRLEREATASLEAMSRTAADYDEHRWGRGKLSTYAEPLWEATAGYLDLRAALQALDDAAEQSPRD